MVSPFDFLSRLVLLAVFAFSAIATEDATVHERIQSARRLIAANEFREAVSALLPLLKDEGRREAGDEITGELLNDLGYAYRMLGECDNAIGALSGASRLLRGPAGASVAGVNLAAALVDCGEVRRAAKLWRATLAPLAESAAPEAAARLWAAGATIEAAERHYPTSESLYTRAIEIWEQTPDRDGERLALARIGRAVDRACLRKFDDANADAVDSPSLLRAAPAVRAAAVGNIALVRFLSGRWEDARAEFAEALRMLGPSPEWTSAPVILGNYSAFLRKIGDHAGAEQATLRAHELKRQLARRGGYTVDVRAMDRATFR